MNNRLYILMSLMLMFSNMFAQLPNFDWAISYGGGDPSFDQTFGESIKVDNVGNIYLIGSFKGTIDFDPDTGIVNYTSIGDYDIYIGKFNKFKKLIWVKSIGGPGEDLCQSFDLDNSGNIYLSGYFMDSVDFDPGSGVNFMTSNGSNDIFVSKMDTSGNFIWVRTIGGNSVDKCNSLIVDSEDNILFAGTFEGTVDFNPGTGIENHTSNGEYDIFLAKLDSLGNYIYSKTIGGSGLDWLQDIIEDENGNIYSTGFFEDTVDFDPGSNSFTLYSNGEWDAFILKIDNLGNFLWTKSFGGISKENSYSLTTDTDGNVYSCGTFNDMVDFNPGTGINTLNSNGSIDCFILKLDAAGNYKWAKTFGGSGTDYCFAISQDQDGNILTSGHYAYSVDFDPGPGSFSLTSNGFDDIFILALDSSGSFEWVLGLNGNAFAGGNSITSDVDNNIYLTGYMLGTIDFDPGPATHYLVGSPLVAGYVLKLKYCVQSYSTMVDTACSYYISPSGSFIWDMSGIYTDAVISSSGCDSIITIDLVILQTDTNFADIGCTSFISPSGNYLWDSSGVYIDTIPNIEGCDSVITIDLTIIEVDNSVTQQANTLMANATGATYQWIDCNNGNTPIPGATNQSFTPTQNGSYAVIVTENGCTDTSSCYTISTIGMGGVEAFSGIKIYPNPANDKLVIDLGNKSELCQNGASSDFKSHSDGQPRIELINSNGQIVLEKQIGNLQKLEFDISHLPAGEYFVRMVVEGEQIFVEKVVKE